MKLLISQDSSDDQFPNLKERCWRFGAFEAPRSEKRWLEPGRAKERRFQRLECSERILRIDLTISEVSELNGLPKVSIETVIESC
jgi:hypothetical protein